MKMRSAVLTTFARQILVMGLGFASIALVSRAIGVDEFGRYSFALAGLSVLQVLISLSFSVVIIHFYEPMRQIGRLGQLLGNGLCIVLCAIFVGTVIAAIAMSFVGYFSLSIDQRGVFLIYLLFALQLIVSYFEAVVIGARDYRLYNILLLGSPVLQLLLLFFLQGVYTTSNDVLCLTLAVTATITPIYWCAARRRGLEYLSTGNNICSTYFAYGMTMWMSNVVTMANYRMPYFIIESLLGPAGLGQYALAAQFSEKLWVPGRAVAAILFPERSSTQANAKSAAGFQQTARLIVGNVAITFVGSVLLFFIFLNYIAVIFGAGYTDVPILALALAPGIVAWSGVTILGAEFAGSGNSGANFIASLAALIVGTISVLLAISEWGLVGAAIGTSIGYIVGFGVSLLLFYRHKYGEP